jgi:hypothetical protein
MGNAAHMPELHENNTALAMDHLRDAAPALDLLGRIDARRVRPASRRFGNLRRLGDDQPARAGPLAVIFDHQIGRRIGWRHRPHPRERGHDNAMGECMGAEGERGKEIGHMRLRLRGCFAST